MNDRFQVKLPRALSKVPILFILSWLIPLIGNATQVASSKSHHNNMVHAGTRATSSSIFLPYKANYVLPFYYTGLRNSTLQGPDGLKNLHTEINFQISLQAKIWSHILGTNWSLYGAYTQHAFWQGYNETAYFRDTNYEPSGFFAYQLEQNSIHLNNVAMGLVHQSNGLGGDLERSWNRIFVRFLFQPNQHWLIRVKPWIRVHNVGEGKDYNPDIEHYLGHYAIYVSYKKYHNVWTLHLQNNLESGFQRGTVEARWTFPLHQGLRGMVKIFSGYGQSMISYNHYTNGIGIGFNVTDWML